MTTRATRQKRHIGQHLTAEARAELQAHFIEAYKDSGMIKHAAKVAGVDRGTVYYWIQGDEAFAASYKEAEQIANGIIRDEIWRRGVAGWLEKQTTVEVDGEGKVTRKTVTVHKFSDACIRLLAQSRMPEFKERLDVTSGEKPINAQEEITRILEDPVKSAAAADLLAIFGPTTYKAGGDRLAS